MKFLLFALTAMLAAGQEFEVATIRPAGPLNAQAVRDGKLLIGQRITGNQVDYGYLSLRNLVMTAYEVKPHQVTVPAWMDEQRYDIHALMPEGTDPKQIPAMLRSLLKERFKLVANKSSKELDVYALEVAKDGHKMKEAPEPQPAAEPAKPAAGAQTMTINGQQMQINQQQIAGGGMNVAIAGGANGAQRITMNPDGRMHLEVERVTMAQFSDTLTQMLDRPVIDRTDLKGNYQVALDLSMADIMQIASKTLGPAAGAGLQAAMAGRGGMDPGTEIIGAVQKLGLRLTKQKAPVEIVMVESAERNPTEN